MNARSSTICVAIKLVTAPCSEFEQLYTLPSLREASADLVHLLQTAGCPRPRRPTVSLTALCRTLTGRAERGAAAVI
jgi:hypothetical protein